MSQSLANIVLHLVFSTKDRRLFLRDEERGQLHAYITGINSASGGDFVPSLTGRGDLIETRSPGPPLRFSPGYHIAGFQPAFGCGSTNAGCLFLCIVVRLYGFALTRFSIPFLFDRPGGFLITHAALPQKSFWVSFGIG